MDNVCRSFTSHGRDFQQNLVIPILRGDSTWVRNGEYTPVGRSREHASPVDFFRLLRSAMLDESIVMVPARGVATTADDLLEESLSVKVESYRPTLFVENARDDEADVNSNSDDGNNDEDNGNVRIVEVEVHRQDEDFSEQEFMDLLDFDETEMAYSNGDGGEAAATPAEPVASTSHVADTAPTTSTGEDDSSFPWSAQRIDEMLQDVIGSVREPAENTTSGSAETTAIPAEPSSDAASTLHGAGTASTSTDDGPARELIETSINPISWARRLPRSHSAARGTKAGVGQA